MDKPICYIVVRQRDDRFVVEVLSSTYDISSQGGTFEDALAAAFERVMLEVERDLDTEGESVTTSAEEKMDRKILNIARVAHEADRAYCTALGDASLKPWDEAPPERKSNVITDVKRFFSDPNITPEELHAFHGVAFEQLPVEQQRKGYLFLSIVRSMA